MYRVYYSNHTSVVMMGTFEEVEKKAKMLAYGEVLSIWPLMQPRSREVVEKNVNMLVRKKLKCTL